MVIYPSCFTFSNSLLQKEKVARVSVTDEVDPFFIVKLLCATEPHQSASLTASPKGEALY